MAGTISSGLMFYQPEHGRNQASAGVVNASLEALLQQSIFTANNTQKSFSFKITTPTTYLLYNKVILQQIIDTKKKKEILCKITTQPHTLAAILEAVEKPIRTIGRVGNCTLSCRERNRTDCYSRNCLYPTPRSSPKTSSDSFSGTIQNQQPFVYNVKGEKM